MLLGGRILQLFWEIKALLVVPVSAELQGRYVQLDHRIVECCVTCSDSFCPVRNALMFVPTALYLSALEKGSSDGSCCAPFSSFCILLLP